MKMGISDLIYRCTECCGTFNRHSLLMVHLWNHIHGNPFKCSSCKQQFSAAHLFHSHMEQHKKETTCKFCLRDFLFKSNLSRHLGIEHKLVQNSGTVDVSFLTGKEFQCKYCEKRFSPLCVYKLHMKDHVKGAHKEKNQSLKLHSSKVRKCSERAKRLFPIFQQLKPKPSTEMTFANRKCQIALQRARGAKSSLCAGSKTKQLYACLYCDKKFDHSRYLTDHLRIHTGRNLHECEVCKKKFLRPCLLQSHKCTVMSLDDIKRTALKSRNTDSRNSEGNGHVHQGVSVKKWEGKENIKLGRGEAQKSSTISSVPFSQITHTKKNPLREEWQEVFSKFKELRCRSYLSNEPDSQRFRCTWCHKSYRTIPGLKLHVRLHVGLDPFECTVCHKKFLYSKSLRIHVRKHHVLH